MKKSTRALIGLVVLEFLLFAGAVFMVSMVMLGIWKTFDTGKAIVTILEVMGGAMGIVGGVLLVAYFTHKTRGN